VTEAAQPGHIVLSTSAFDLDDVRSGISYLAHNLPCTYNANLVSMLQ